jgi:hypothetical protein
MPNVVQFHRLSGEIDCRMRAVARDMQSRDEMRRQMMPEVDPYDVSSRSGMVTIGYTTGLRLDQLLSEHLLSEYL